MFESIFGSANDAVTLIKHDHDKVKELFEQFKNAEDLRSKKRVAAQAILELKLHAEVEEKIFYRAARAAGLKKDILNEADEEHHVAKLLIAELETLPPTDDHWEAKFTVLAENIRHHIREEESDMLPQSRDLNLDMEALGQQILAMKEDLLKNGIPACDEEKLIRASGARADSPAKNAKGKTSAPKTKVKAVKRNGAKKSAAKHGTAKSSKKGASSRSVKSNAARSSGKRKANGHVKLVKKAAVAHRANTTRHQAKRRVMH